MTKNNLSSCSNCWHNSVQYGSIGLPFGYCVEHGCVLRQPNDLTCGRHMRKDMLLETARVFKRLHLKTYGSEESICKLIDGSSVSLDDTVFFEKDLSFLRKDKVGKIVADYGMYGTKVESISQLRFAASDSIRAEIAMLNLGRAYVARCFSRSNNWKSGIHILWWVKQSCSEPMPEINPSDIIYQTTVNFERQVELAKWSVLLLRLTYISDIGEYAKSVGDSGIGALHDIAEEAALATEKPSLKKLERWIKKEGLSKINKILPESIYREMSRSLHVE